MADPGDDSLTEDIWASPSSKAAARKEETTDAPKTPTASQGRDTPPYDHEAALRKELEGVQNINEVIEGVIGTLERAKGNMNTVSGTVSNASTLLGTWTRILSQTEHNQRLILDPNWKGATEDLVEVEGEALRKQQAAERRAAEEERRREDARRRAEDEERKRQAGTSSAAPRATRGLRSRGARAGRGASGGRGAAGEFGANTSSFAGESSLSSIPSGRSASGIGRGFGGTRGSRGSSTRGRAAR